MSLLEELERKATGFGATIVYPEPEDERIVEACRLVADRHIARPVLVGRASDLPCDAPPGVDTEAIGGSNRLEQFAARYAQSRRERRSARTDAMARRLVGRPLVYAAMMVSCGHADGMVAGVAHPTASVLQAAGLAIGYGEGITAPSSCFIMVVPRLRGGRDVPLVFADCAVAIDPSAEQLAGIALASAESARRLLGLTPRVAMLSFSTAGSASHAMADKVKEAAGLAAERIPDGYVEGELQFDAAINPDVAASKGVAGGEVAGRANVLIFPDLNSGNICYKAVRELCGAQAVGPVLQGFAWPVSDLSRSASVEEIVGVTVTTVLQCAEQ